MPADAEHAGLVAAHRGLIGWLSLARLVGWCVRLAAALVLAALGGAEGVAAHLGGSAYIVVAQDFIVPGQPFRLIAADMGEQADVALEIVHEAVVAQLGNARAATDGHFTVTLSLPTDFPLGYAQVIATATDSSQTSTWVLVGEPTASSPPPPGTGSWWSDPSVLVLVVFVMGAIVVAGYVLLRPRAGRAAPVASTGSARRALARKRRR